MPESAALTPLAGLLVVDFTHTLSGPYCTQMLADAGATVIKIEPPDGEFSRRVGLMKELADGARVAVYLASVNRGKHDLVLDLKHAEGLRIARELASRADVVIENFAPGTMDRLGLNFDALRAEFPRLVTCSLSLYGGFASAGELARRGGLAMVAESVSSVLAMQRESDGFPVILGMPLGDMTTGMAAYGAIMTALLQRERTGSGQHLDIAMVKVLLSLNSIAIVTEQVQPATEDERYAITGAAFGIFRAADGYFALAVNSDRLFARFAAAIGEDWLAGDPRYALQTQRAEHEEEINRIFEKWASSRSVEEVIGVIGPAGVPCGRVATPHDVLADDDLSRLRYLEEVADGGGGHLLSPANPFGFRRDRTAIPGLGQHSRTVLGDQLGIDDTEYDRLRSTGAFGPPPN